MSYNLMHELARPIFASEHRCMVILERGEDPADMVSATKYVPSKRFAPISKRTVVITNPRSVAQVEYHDHSEHTQQCECWECRQASTTQIKAIIAVEGGVEVSSDVSRHTIQPWERLSKAELAEFSSAMAEREEEVVSSDMTSDHLDIIEAGFDRLEVARRLWLRESQYCNGADNIPHYRRLLRSFVSSRYRRPNDIVGARSFVTDMSVTARDEKWGKAIEVFLGDANLEDHCDGLWADTHIGVEPFDLERKRFAPPKVKSVRRKPWTFVTWVNRPRGEKQKKVEPLEEVRKAA